MSTVKIFDLRVREFAFAIRAFVMMGYGSLRSHLNSAKQSEMSPTLLRLSYLAKTSVIFPEPKVVHPTLALGATAPVAQSRERLSFHDLGDIHMKFFTMRCFV